MSGHDERERSTHPACTSAHLQSSLYHLGISSNLPDILDVCFEGIRNPFPGFSRARRYYTRQLRNQDMERVVELREVTIRLLSRKFVAPKRVRRCHVCWHNHQRGQRAGPAFEGFDLR